MNISVCGIDCSACSFMKENKCEGCRIVAPRGKCVWGERCELFDCVITKNLPHCGKCEDFPCQKLIDAHKGESHENWEEPINNLRALRD